MHCDTVKFSLDDGPFSFLDVNFISLHFILVQFLRFASNFNFLFLFFRMTGLTQVRDFVLETSE